MHDPRLRLLRRALAASAHATVRREPDERDAAVAVVVRPALDLEVLLIKRAERVNDPWSGHMALPGGLRARDDSDLLATALREAREEVGLRIDRERALLGSLDEIAPRNRRLPPIVIAPFVVAVEPDVEPVPDDVEVADALWVPINALRDARARSSVSIEREGARLSFPSLRYREHEIWGLTHRILTSFLDLAEDAGV